MSETSSASDHSSRYGRGLPLVCCLRARWQRSRNSAASASFLPVARSIAFPPLLNRLWFSGFAAGGNPRHGSGVHGKEGADSVSSLLSEVVVVLSRATARSTQIGAHVVARTSSPGLAS